MHHPHTSHWVVAAVTAAFFAVSLGQTLPVKMCVTSDAEMTKCNAVKASVGSQGVNTAFSCEKADNRYACMRLVRAGTMDVMRADDVEIFPAAEIHGLVPIVKESMSEDLNAATFFYKAVIVVKASGPISSLSDLKGKKSCHTGVGKTVGWTVPVSNLMAKNILPRKNCDNTVKDIGAFFSQSCAPGALDDNNDLDGDNPTNVCALCGDTRCPMSDTYGGYAGAFKCLHDGRGDVAFVKHSTISSLMNDSSSGMTIVKGNYQLLCPDDTLKSVDEWQNCHWATRPMGVLMASNTRSRDHVTKMQHMFEMASMNVANLLSSGDLFDSKTKRLFPMGYNANYKEYLGDGYLRTLTDYRNCDETVRWCVSSDSDYLKCTDMRSAFAAARITANLTCVQTASLEDCMKKIKADEADLMTAGSGHLYKAGRYYDLAPIMSEGYGSQGSTKYWAVAVARTANANVNINNLKGKTSCHTGLGRTVGWNVPVGFFVKRGDVKLKDSHCNLADAMSEFFSSSCVPGADGKDMKPELCSLCGGKGKCQASSSNPYSGYNGAIHCLWEKKADVAFVKQTTVPDVIAGNELSGVSASDFQLLCSDGSRKPIDQWQSCNLAEVPSRTVVTRKSVSADIRKRYIHILQRAAYRFGRASKPHSSNFRLFSSPDGSKDTIFKDSSGATPTFLQAIPPADQDYATYLKKKNYLAQLESIDVERCAGTGHRLVPSLLTAVLTMTSVFVMTK